MEPRGKEAYTINDFNMFFSHFCESNVTTLQNITRTEVVNKTLIGIKTSVCEDSGGFATDVDQIWTDYCNCIV